MFSQVYNRQFKCVCCPPTVNGTLRKILLAQRPSAARSFAEYQAGAMHRGEAMARAYASGAYSLAAIAGHFGVHYSTVSRAVKRAEGGG